MEIKPCKKCGVVPVVTEDERYIRISCPKVCKVIRQDLLAPRAKEFAVKYWEDFYTK
jgi:phage FluMu protein Com